MIDSISILNDWNVANNDGIDLDHCRNVRVANCHIDTADDGIVLKNTPNFASYGRSENITVTGCTIASRSCALKLDEAYAPPGIRNVVFDACVIFRSNRGLCIQSRDEGDIENILFSNITIETQLQSNKWWGAGEPIHVSHLPRNSNTKLGTSGRFVSATFFARARTAFIFVAARRDHWRISCSTTCASKWARPPTSPADFMMTGRLGLLHQADNSLAFTPTPSREFLRGK